MAHQLENLRGVGKGMRTVLRLGVRGLHGPPKANEYVETAVYPKIHAFKTKEEKNVARTKYDVKSLKTVEEKMYQINRPKLYGWYSYIVDTAYMPSDILDWAKFATCTQVIDSLPEKLVYNKETDKQVDEVISQLGKEIELAIRSEEFIEYNLQVTNDKINNSEIGATGKDTITDYTKDLLRSNFLIKRIHNLIHSNLSLNNPHVRNTVEDSTPRVEGFWFRGGIQPDKSMMKKRKGRQDADKKKMRLAITDSDREMYERRVEDGDYINQAYERAIQIKCDTVLQMRHEDPLAEFLSRDDPLCTDINIPQVDFDPRCYGFQTKCRHGTNIPGYWPQDNNRMGLLSYFNRNNRYNEVKMGSTTHPTEEILKYQDVSKAIFSNFAWTLGQATQLGFSPLTELTFPLASQSVNTDGRLWSFFAYQLNTCDLSSNDHTSHTHQNLLWASPTVQLYDKIEDGKLTNFDPDCLKPLIKMYLNKPKVRSYSLTPYLDHERPLVTDHADPYQRKRFLKIIRDQCSNRPIKDGKPELYMWEKIKLIDHQAMPVQFRLAPRRRWWHMQKIDPMGKEHWNPEFINCDEKVDKYIPKALRPAWTRKGKLNRRYNKYAPKIRVPLSDTKTAVWAVPDMNYRGEKDD